MDEGYSTHCTTQDGAIMQKTIICLFTHKTWRSSYYFLFPWRLFRRWFTFLMFALWLIVMAINMCVIWQKQLHFPVECCALCIAISIQQSNGLDGSFQWHILIWEKKNISESMTSCTHYHYWMLFPYHYWSVCSETHCIDFKILNKDHSLLTTSTISVLRVHFRDGIEMHIEIELVTNLCQ